MLTSPGSSFCSFTWPWFGASVMVPFHSTFNILQSPYCNCKLPTSYSHTQCSWKESFKTIDPGQGFDVRQNKHLLIEKIVILSFRVIAEKCYRIAGCELFVLIADNEKSWLPRIIQLSLKEKPRQRQWIRVLTGQFRYAR